MFSVRKNSPLLVEDGKTYKLDNPSNWSLTGYSRAGERTSFKVNELNILLDAGLGLAKPVDGIFLTHTHIDHCWQLPRLFGNLSESVPVWFPNQSYKGLTKFLDAAACLSYPKKTFSETELWLEHCLKPNPISVGDKIKLKSYSVEVLQAVHTCQSVGYGFFKTKKKLKQEYSSCSNNEIIELRKSRIEVSEEVSTPEFAFYCDSTIENLINYSEWKLYPTVVVECTGFEDSHTVDIVRERGHTHLDELLPIIEANKDKAWRLIHSSLKTDDEKILKKEKEFKSKGFNVEFLV